MLLTKDQRFLLGVLRETGWMRRDQLLPLMRLYDPAKVQSHCGELIPMDDGLICLAELRGKGVDHAMLCALDILLSLASGPPIQLTSRVPPYKLCFLLEREGGRIDAFAVLPVEPGRESITDILLAQQPQNVTVLLFLTSLEQHQLLHLRQRHYFVVRQDGRLRFFKGGEASQ